MGAPNPSLITSRSGIILSGSKGMISAFYSTPGGICKYTHENLGGLPPAIFREN